MKTVDNLADALTEKGVVCISIRAPKGGSGWIANTRVDDTGWKSGKPCDTLEEALLDVLWIPDSPPPPVRYIVEGIKIVEPVDDMEDLLG